VQSRHAGIKARGGANEKREEKTSLADSLLATAEKGFWKIEKQKQRE
jgi:hypothetical protein